MSIARCISSLRKGRALRYLVVLEISLLLLLLIGASFACKSGPPKPLKTQVPASPGEFEGINDPSLVALLQAKVAGLDSREKKMRATSEFWSLDQTMYWDSEEFPGIANLFEWHSLEGLHLLGGLRLLKFTSTNAKLSLMPLGRLEKLREVEIRGTCDIDSWQVPKSRLLQKLTLVDYANLESPIQLHVDVVELAIYRSQFNGELLLEACPSLEALTLIDCDGVVDVRLSREVNLERVYIAGTTLRSTDFIDDHSSTLKSVKID